MKYTGFLTLFVYLSAGLAVCIPPVAVNAEGIDIPFGAAAPGEWRAKVFRGETSYALTVDGGIPAMRADSRGTASGLVYEVVVDLNETPCLNWSWKVSSVLVGLDETTKAGDDFPARVYVIVSGGLFFWDTRALNYVWSGSHPAGSAWPNPYTDRSTMVAVQSGSGRTGQWVRESRNVRDDFKRFAGADIDEIDAVAIMTDTDDSGLSATAYYRDLRFSALCAP